MTKPRLKQLAAQIGRFSLTGTTSSIAEVAVFAAMTNLVHAPTLAAEVSAVSTSYVIGYLMNHHFTFEKRSGSIQSALYYLLLNVFNILFVTFFIDTLSNGHHMSKILLKIISLLICSVWNFVICRTFIFSNRKRA